MSTAMPLAELLQDFVPTAVENSALIAASITGMTLDSRQVQAGDAFIALKGASTHGIAHAQQALARGAATILFEPPLPADIAVPDQAIAVPQLRSKLGAMANRFYATPSQALSVIGITGTNGKTSSVQLLAQALSIAGARAGTIGTLGAGLVGDLQAGERTTPDVIAVHRLLAQLRGQGASHVAMEVSSHALDQGRVDAVAFQIAVFTNLTRDHLDYHQTMQAYGEAKAKLFDWPTLQAVVINGDDPFSATLIDRVDSRVKKILVSSRAASDATLRAEQIVLTHSGMQFVLIEADQQQLVQCPLLGRFNVDNLLAVAGVLRALDWPMVKIAEILSDLTAVPGRMSRIGGNLGQPLVAVDYAHTPDALEQTLTSLRAHAGARLICVFGCGGDRDRGKRPLMANVAQSYADVVIVTDDNPRSENGDGIIAQIMSGFVAPQSVQIIRDRASAIASAITAANADDIVLIAGKGHETYQEIAGVRQPFDDLAVAKICLEQRA